MAGRTAEHTAERTNLIMRLRNEGKTCAQIGALVGLSKQRVWSIANREEIFTIIEALTDDSLDS